MNLQTINVSDELKYAVECGVKIEYTVLDNGDIQAVWANGQCVEIISTDIEETTEIELDTVEVEEVEETQEITTVEEISEQYNLTTKEQNVLKGIIYESLEDGLPVFTASVAEYAGLTQKQTVGVVSSLYAKGFLQDYNESGQFIGCDDMYHLTSEWFEKFVY